MKKKKKEGKKLKVAAIVGIIVCVLIVVFGLLAVYFLLPRNENVELPSIAGKSKEAVEQKLISLDLEIDYEEEPSDDIAEGYVIDYKDKKVNSKVKKGSTVTIIVSSGLTGVVIEDYKGRHLTTVQLELEQAGLTVVAIPKKVSIEQEDYEDAFEGMILSQNKDPQTRLKEGGVIELTYATLITIYPDFTDGTWDKKKAQQFCDDNKITCKFEEKEDSTHKEDTILEQGRQAGGEVKEGVTLTLTVAVKPKPVEPPVVEPPVTPDDGDNE